MIGDTIAFFLSRMSLAAPDFDIRQETGPTSDFSSGVGLLVIEPAASTPLGPRIAFANEFASVASGYELASLVGSPLGLIYDHGDVASLVRKLPAIAARSGYCWMDRNLHRNGGERVPVRWTIRPTRRSEGGADHFTLTFAPLPTSGGQTWTGFPPPSTIEATARPGVPNVASSSAIHETAESDPGANDYHESRSESLALTAGGVAHDFKNALQTIKSNLEMAHAEAKGIGSPECSGTNLRGYLEDAEAALFDAEALAQQMLAFTKGQDAARCLFDVSECVQRVSRLCTAGTRVRCRIHRHPGLKPVEGDPNQVYQVLHNLVINACQAMPNGGTLDLSAGSTTLTDPGNVFEVKPGSYTVMSVKDRGCGIPEELLPRIFDKRFSTKENGNGFGLASCQAIIQRHGGVIRVSSRVGVGTEFLIFLPSSDAALPEASPPRTPNAATRSAKEVRKKEDSNGGRVLVVEDQRGVSKATCGMLGHLGYESLVAETGEQALHLYRRSLDSPECFDLVLLDMTLPGGLDGKEVLAELKRTDPEVNVIATSGYFDDGPSHELMELGFTGVLAKPYSMDSLAITVDHALNSRA